MSAKMLWTAEADSRLRVLWLEGLSTNKIADAMGTSKNSVVGRAHRLALPSRGSPIKGQVSRGSVAEKRRETLARAAQARQALFAREQAKSLEHARLAVIPGEAPPPPPAPPKPPPEPPPVVHRFVPAKKACRFPLWGDGGRADPFYGKYCDAPVDGERVYCATHAAKCFTTMVGRRPAPLEVVTAKATRGEQAEVKRRDEDPVELDLAEEVR